MKANSFHEVKNPQANRVRHRSPYLLTGLIRCSRCGFAFQGWSGKIGGKRYWKYIDGGNKNKGVCSHLSIRKDILEDYAIRAVKETISDPLLIKNIELHLKRLLAPKARDNRSELERLNRLIRENEDKIQKLIGAIEQCGGSETLLSRLGELEKDQKDLKTRLGGGQVEPAHSIDIGEVKRLVERFVQNFEKEFPNAPIEERKALIKKVISQVIVDREKHVVRFYVRRLPSVSPIVDELLQTKREPIDIMSSQSSGGRT